VTTAAVLLAAGAGSRFAGPDHKLRTRIGATSVVGRALDVAVAARLDEVVLVTGAVDLADEAATRPVTLLVNEGWSGGIATSLQVGVARARAAGHDVVVVGLADQPGVTVEAWCLVAAAEGSPIAVATYGDRRGNPVRLAAAVWPDLPPTGDEGARALMRRCPELVTEVPCPGSPDDIDTVEDLRRWI
jgi:CTP:molybdopterin cytidylyltransferase MocA